jgi:hypothetical protein
MTGGAVSNIDMNIANTLGIEPNPEVVDIVPVKAISVDHQYNPSDADRDYDEVRKNLKCIIEKSQEAIEGISELAQDSQQARAYEVMAQLIQSSLEANNRLMDIHRRMKDLKKEEKAKTTTVTNNSIYVGSTADLQKMIRDQRKAIDRGDIVDEQ